MSKGPPASGRRSPSSVSPHGYKAVTPTPSSCRQVPGGAGGQLLEGTRTLLGGVGYLGICEPLPALRRSLADQ